MGGSNKLARILEIHVAHDPAMETREDSSGRQRAVIFVYRGTAWIVFLQNRTFQITFTVFSLYV